MEFTILPTDSNIHETRGYFTGSEQGNATTIYIEPEFQLNDMLTKHWAYVVSLAMKLYGPYVISAIGIAFNIFALCILATNSLTGGITPHLIALSVFDSLALLSQMMTSLNYHLGIRYQWVCMCIAFLRTASLNSSNFLKVIIPYYP